MAEEIKVNQAAVAQNAAAISGAAEYFQGVPLNSVDTESTITANGSGQQAYGKSQQLMASFGATIEQDAKNIRSIGNTFEEYDKMMSQLWENGYRYQTLTAGK